MNTLNNLAQLQNSSNKTMRAIGKAAALVEIGISTAKGAIAAYSSLAGIPIVGPALGAAAAAALIAYGAERAAKVAGLQEGGIVRATPGGVPAVIGEGGRDEAVIPLEEGFEGGGLGTTINITVNGGLLGDAESAREFAVAVDNELFSLRQDNESNAFDQDII